jgi:hypothetical protein
MPHAALQPTSKPGRPHNWFSRIDIVLLNEFSRASPGGAWPYASPFALCKGRGGSRAHTAARAFLDLPHCVPPTSGAKSAELVQPDSRPRRAAPSLHLIRFDGVLAPNVELGALAQACFRYRHGTLPELRQALNDHRRYRRGTANRQNAGLSGLTDPCAAMWIGATIRVAGLGPSVPSGLSLRPTAVCNQAEDRARPAAGETPKTARNQPVLAHQRLDVSAQSRIFSSRRRSLSGN